MRWGWTLLALIVGSFACAPARAQSAETVELFERGTEAYRAGRYEEAADLFARAHAIEPVPDLTYNLARSLENLGRHVEAAEAYRRYLTESPDAEDRAGIEGRIHTLETREAERQRLAEERDRLLAERELAAQRRAASGDPSGPWPWIVTGVGAATLIAGAITGGVAVATYDSAASPDQPQTRSDELEREANDLATVANVLFVVGSVLGVAGVVWGTIAIVTSQGAAAPEAEVSIVPGGLVLRGRF